MICFSYENMQLIKTSWSHAIHHYNEQYLVLIFSTS